jgi:mRNA interferase RelE/StbE
MAYSVYLLPEAKKKFDKFPATIKKRVDSQIKRLSDFPKVRNSIKVQGREDTFRFRVGDYRILFKSYSDKKAIVVIDIDKRGRIYKRMK